MTASHLIRGYGFETLADVQQGIHWDPNRLNRPHLHHGLQNLKRDHDCELDSIATPYNNPGEVPGDVRHFLDLGAKSPEKWWGPNGLYVEDLPIKVPGGRVQISRDVYHSSFRAVINKCLRFEMKYNPVFEDQYFYLTIQQSHVEKQTVQRQAGMHLDGFQKPTIIPQITQHQLAITNVIPTAFVAHKFDVDKLPTDKKGLFKGLQEQSEGLVRHTPKPYELHLLNAFCPHEPGYATKDCFRTFIRFSASVIPFMGSGNTRNPLLDLEWNAETKTAYYESIVA